MSDPKIDPVWHREQVERFVVEQPRYICYARTLQEVLNQACTLHAPLGIVQSRAKSVASFAEKAARKAYKYRDPVHQITDLCGARVVVNTQDQMNAICRFVRQEFVIDEANSLDASTRLAEAEFGYRSVHFIVQLNRPASLGIPIPLDQIGDRKAEIQVRTVLQHAWAAVTHDRLYKSGFKVPVRLRRLGHRIAALLEDGDAAFNAFECDMQAYLGNYSAFLPPKELAYEIEIQRLVLGAEPKPENKPAIALRLAKLARAAGQDRLVVEVLSPYEAEPGSCRLQILLELGTALVHENQADRHSRGFRQGCDLLREAAGKVSEGSFANPTESASDRKLRAAAAVVLAEHSARADARGHYTDALQLDPDDPYILCSQLAYTLDHTGDRAVIDSAMPAILRAIATCCAHVAAGMELPRAWFTMGRLNLLLRRDVAALGEYAKGVRFYLGNAGSTWSAESLDRECAFLEHIQGRAESRSLPNTWVEQLLRLGYWLKQGRPGSVDEAVGRKPTRRQFDPSRPVLIVAGGTHADVLPRVKGYAALLKAVIDRFDGVVISGGTNVGVPGMIGEAAAELKQGGRKRCELVGYHPYYLPAGITPGPGYDDFVPGQKEEAFGCGEPLQVWIDLLASGIEPASVRLLGIDGGQISYFEYALALSLGAWVGLIQSSSRSADLVLNDPDWSNLTTLLPLPNDPMTAQAFVLMGAIKVPAEELERMGQAVHENYLGKTRPDYRKPNTLPWCALPEDFRRSSCEQAAYAISMLRRSGYRVEKTSGPARGAPIAENDVECLAELEHGRWNLERMQSGWRFASQKDEQRRLSPYIIPWAELPESIREWDRRAVRLFPTVLAAGGYEVRPPAAKTSRRPRSPRTSKELRGSSRDS